MQAITAGVVNGWACGLFFGKECSRLCIFHAMKKTIAIIVFIVFILFTAVQYNDPDALRWIAIYGYVSLAALGAYFNRVPRWAIYAGMIVCLIWMGTLFKDFIHWIQMGMPSIVDEMHTTKPHIELVREFLGLLLAMIGLWVVRPHRNQ